jgi:hypothetical protein
VLHLPEEFEAGFGGGYEHRYYTDEPLPTISAPETLECDPISDRQEPPTTDHNWREDRDFADQQFTSCGELWQGEPVEKP